MTYQEIVTEIDQLTMEEQVSLLAHLQRTLHTQVAQAAQQPRGTIEQWRGTLSIDALLPESGIRSPLDIRETSLERVLGMAKPDGPPPTDQEIEDILVNALLEKHS